MRKFVSQSLSAVVCLALLATSAAAQTSAVVGTVRDNTGGVLPGVTVEVASPALIEKARTTVSDGDGKYQVVNLRPGTSP